LTIRNGSRSKLMSGYDTQMNETEMWSVVRYVRTLEGAQYVAPSVPATTTPPVGG
jgi:mono/diheme cytochrome c family protein